MKKLSEQLEREIRAWVGIPEPVKKRSQSPYSAPKMRVTMSVRRIVDGSVTGVTFKQEFVVSTISELEAQIEAKKQATKLRLQVWAILEVSIL